MVKIWGKILVEDKVIKGKTFEIDEKKSSFFDMLKNVCQGINIPTPILLDKHVYDFNIFHICIFKPDDFIEPVTFEKFVLELLKY